MDDKLKVAWELRLQLCAEGRKYWAKGDKHRDESIKCWDEGDKLYSDGSNLWAEAILKVHGNIKLKWKSPTHCVLQTGEEFTEKDAAIRRGGKEV